MWHEYPYSQYYSDIDHMCHMCHKLGYRLEVVGDNLRLIDAKNRVISSVQIHYSETALNDVDGKPIKSYIISGSVDGDYLVLTKGDGTFTSLKIPYSEKAKTDIAGKDLTGYTYTVQVAGDKLQVVKGDGTIVELTVPYAVKASTSESGRNLDTFACTLAVDGRNLVLSDALGRELSRVTPAYAEMAEYDVDGDAIKDTYGADLTTGTTTVKMYSKDGTLLSEITVPYATAASTDETGLAFRSGYVNALVVDGDGKRIGVNAPNGQRLSTVTVPFATQATDAINAVEQIAVVGDQIVFTTFGGQSFSITAPYAVKSQRDDNGNIIKNTYIASVANDPNTGELKFYDAVGTLLATLQPTTYAATRDDHNNLIADYIKSIVADNQSNYVIATHGTGDTDSIIINYANRAWKDTLDHPIQNYYISWLTCEEDVEDGHWKLVMWNGDVPRAEIGRLEITAYSAQTDTNGRDLTTYVGNVEVIANKITVSDGNGDIIDEIVGEVDLSNIGTTTATVKSMTTANVPGSFAYNASTKDVSFTEGTPAAATDVTVVTGISGSTVQVDFDD